MTIITKECYADIQMALINCPLPLTTVSQLLFNYIQIQAVTSDYSMSRAQIMLGTSLKNRSISYQLMY